VIQLAPEVLDEIDEAMAWYDKRRLGLGDELLTEVEHALDQVESRPRSFPRLCDVPEDLTVRRAQLDRFPFALVFLELREGHVRVVALAHMKRRPGYWLGRVVG
jgi:toxin ParE1/3/4